MKQQKTNNWQIKKLGEVCRITYGKGLPTKKLKESGFPVFGANGIIGFNDTYLYKEPQVLISCRGAYSGKINFSPPFCFVTNNSLILEINSNEDLDKRFLYYILHTVNKSKLVTGTAQPQVTINNAVELTFNLPPLETQQALVSKIEELFSELDKGIAELKTAQQQLKTYRQSVLKSAFEGKLTNENVKNGELPDGWKVVKISDISRVVRGGSPRPAGDPKYYDGDIPFLKVADLTKDNGIYLTTFKYTIKEAGLHKTRQITPNTLLLSNSGATLGVPKICMINATMNDGVAAFLELDIRSNHYLYYFWLSKTLELRGINMGAGQPNLNTDLIKDYKVPYCSFEEQHRIVQEIESRLSVADKMEQSIQESLQKAEALRQSILKKAFSGELV